MTEEVTDPGTDTKNETIAGGKPAAETGEDTPKDDTKDKGKETPKDPAPDKEKEPEKKDAPVKLVLPEGSLLGKKDIDVVEKFANDNGLDQAFAEKILAQNEKAQESALAEHDAQVTEWGNEVKADKELGGTNFEQSAEFSRRATDAFGSEEFIAMLNKTGYGDHPEVVRTFARIGRAMADDKTVRGKTGPTDKTRLADRLYPPKN